MEGESLIIISSIFLIFSSALFFVDLISNHFNILEKRNKDLMHSLEEKKKNLEHKIIHLEENNITLKNQINELKIHNIHANEVEEKKLNIYKQEIIDTSTKMINHKIDSLKQNLKEVEDINFENKITEFLCN